MTIINPNSIAGITSVTAQADIINFYKSDGNQAGLGLNGVNFNTTAGISTFNNLVVGGVLTYEDVKNVDSIGIITARGGLNVTANTDTDTLNVSGISTFGGVVKIPTVAGTNTNSSLNVLFQTATGVIDGGSGLTYNPAADSFFVNGLAITNATVYSNGGSSLKLADANYSSTTYAQISNKVEIGVNDNVAGAFKLKEGSNEYITVDTTNSSELIKFGTAGSERARITSAGLFGIGVTPISIFHVRPLDETNFLVRNEGSTVVLASETNNGRDNNRGMALEATQFEFIEGGSEKVRIDSSGRLLLGTTTEGYASADDLTVATTGNTGITIRSSTGGLGTLAFSDGTSGAAEYDGYIQYSQADQYMDFGGAGGNIRLRIDSSGRVLIGTTTEGHANADELTVSKSTGVMGMTLRSDDSSNCHFYFSDATSGAGEYAGFINYQHSDNSLHIGANSAERLRIDSSGRVLIGTTTAAGNGIHVLYSTVNSAVEFQNNTTGTGSGQGLYVGNSTSNIGYLWNYANDALVFATNNTERLRIASTGEIGVGMTQDPPTGSFTIRLTETPEFNLYSTQHAQNNNCKINFGVGQSASVSGNTGARIEMNIPATGGQMTGELKFHTNQGDNLVERLRIASNGRVLYGDHINDRGAELQYEGSQHTCMGVHRNGAHHGAPAFVFSASRGTSAGSNTIVQNGDYLGMISFKGTDGSDLANGAYITGIVDGTPGSNDMPTRLGFWTSADGSESPTERLTIDSSGRVTKPQQPRMLVKINSTTTLSNAKMTNWSTAMFNVGSLWDETNKRIVAPTDGAYLIGGNFRIGAPGHIRVVRFNLQHYNTSNQIMAIYGGGIGGSHNYDDGSGGYDHPYVSFTNMIYMAAGTYVELHCSETAVQYTSYIQVSNEVSHLWACLLQ